MFSLLVNEVLLSCQVVLSSHVFYISIFCVVVYNYYHHSFLSYFLYMYLKF